MTLSNGPSGRIVFHGGSKKTSVGNPFLQDPSLLQVHLMSERGLFPQLSLAFVAATTVAYPCAANIPNSIVFLNGQLDQTAKTFLVAGIHRPLEIVALAAIFVVELDCSLRRQQFHTVVP